MDITKAKNSYIFTTRVELEDGDYIVLREPTTLQLRDLGRDEAKTFDVLYELFDSCLVEHSFTNGERPATAKEVAAVLKDSGSTFSNILNEWLKSLPLQRASDKKSGKSLA